MASISWVSSTEAVNMADIVPSIIFSKPGNFFWLGLDSAADYFTNIINRSHIMETEVALDLFSVFIIEI